MARTNKELKALKTLSHDIRIQMLEADNRLSPEEYITRDIFHFVARRSSIATHNHTLSAGAVLDAIGQAAGFIADYVEDADDNIKHQMLGALAAGFMKASGIDLPEIPDESIGEDSEEVIGEIVNENA
jgi:hypothetical protein